MKQVIISELSLCELLNRI